jgi:dolichol-phosphate mannosyltransferase
LYIRSVGKNLVIIPTYNEKENIEKMIHKVFSLSPAFSLLIIDDGSPDGTAQIVKGLQQKYSELHLLERSGKQGLGTAYIKGFKWAIDQKDTYDFIFEMDCDFSHNPDHLARLLEACKGDADVAVGSRYCSGGHVKNWPWGRILMSYFASVYVRLILWISIRDTTAGFKCYRRKVLETIELDEVRFMGYAFQIEMKYRSLKKGFKVVEVPITFIDRTEGVSKMSTNIFKEAFWGVLQMRSFVK